jgi:hypothetical protein
MTSHLLARDEESLGRLGRQVARWLCDADGSPVSSATLTALDPDPLIALDPQPLDALDLHPLTGALDPDPSGAANTRIAAEAQRAAGRGVQAPSETPAGHQVPPETPSGPQRSHHFPSGKPSETPSVARYIPAPTSWFSHYPANWRSLRPFESGGGYRNWRCGKDEGIQPGIQHGIQPVIRTKALMLHMSGIRTGAYHRRYTTYRKYSM